LKRFALITLALAGLALAASAAPALAKSAAPAHASALRGLAAAASSYHDPLCESHHSTCADVYDNVFDSYVGHDEPSVEFKSTIPGSGNDITYLVRLPRDPRSRPLNGGGGGTWTFQLRSTFWLGLTLCDTESAPEFTKTCTPNTDANNLVGSNPAAPDYIGKHPGNAFLELQFYEPGYVPQFEGFGCAAHVYCAAMTIDSLGLNQNTGVANTSACDNYILGGEEPINWAYVTKSGVSQAPADPLFTGTFSNPNFTAVNPNLSKDLLMNPGDLIRIHMHDTPAGYRTDLFDVTTGESGSMTASIANGFAHVLYTPDSNTCTSAPYAFHSEYSTATPRGNTWSAHTTNVSYSDEIGHFENCFALDANFNCAVPGLQDQGSGLDPDDGNSFCVPAQDSSFIKINGCFSSDGDWDGNAYQFDWPGTLPNVAADQAQHPQPVRFSSPTTAGGTTPYSTVVFETDLPRIEASDSQDNPPFCNTHTGVHCVNPPNGAQFYPFFSTTGSDEKCQWQEGGPFIPNTQNDFGGSSTTEFGPLLGAVYPGAGFTPLLRFDNFNSGPIRNPCP
jgi:hypothetical protein